MAITRLARFVSEVAPPQYISVMRQRRKTILETIKEDEREGSTNEKEESMTVFNAPFSSAPCNQTCTSN